MSRTRIYSVFPLCTALALLPVAAHAEQGSSAERVGNIADSMDDPATQRRVADMVESVGEVIMQLPIGRFAEAIETAHPGTVADDIDANTTVADLAGPDARRLPRDLSDKSSDMMAMMSGMMRAFTTMMQFD